jgi:hypothetical protein
MKHFYFKKQFTLSVSTAIYYFSKKNHFVQKKVVKKGYKLTKKYAFSKIVHTF